MKTIYTIILGSFFSLTSLTSWAQKSKTETFEVLGNCGMCKKTIEKAAKDAGATEASWNSETKKLTVSYKKNTDATKIQNKIAEVGYDNSGAKATDEAYNKLHGCCKYDRAPKANTESKK